MLLNIAKYIVNKCVVEGHVISHIQLQRILYFIQLHWIKKFNKELFEEQFYSYPCGPVIPDIYYIYCGYGNKILTTYKIKINKKIKKEIDPIIEEERDKKIWEEDERLSYWKKIEYHTPVESISFLNFK